MEELKQSIEQIKKKDCQFRTYEKTKFICVKVKIDNKYKEFRITHLVARCFKIEGKGKRIIHVNKNIWDNSVPNLKYVDQKV